MCVCTHIYKGHYTQNFQDIRIRFILFFKVNIEFLPKRPEDQPPLQISKEQQSDWHKQHKIKKDEVLKKNIC